MVVNPLDQRPLLTFPRLHIDRAHPTIRREYSDFVTPFIGVILVLDIEYPAAGALLCLLGSIFSVFALGLTPPPVRVYRPGNQPAYRRQQQE
jgi:hypothetical protein